MFIIVAVVVVHLYHLHHHYGHHHPLHHRKAQVQPSTFRTSGLRFLEMSSSSFSASTGPAHAGNTGPAHGTTSPAHGANTSAVPAARKRKRGAPKAAGVPPSPVPADANADEGPKAAVRKKGAKPPD